MVPLQTDPVFNPLTDSLGYFGIKAISFAVYKATWYDWFSVGAFAYFVLWIGASEAGLDFVNPWWDRVAIASVLFCVVVVALWAARA